MASAVYCEIDGSDRVDDFLIGHLWRELNSIGRWMVLLDNQNGTYDSLFHVQDSFELKIDTVSLMKGYVEIVKPCAVQAQDIFLKAIEVHGVSYGQPARRRIKEVPYYNIADSLADIIDDLINTQFSGDSDWDITYAKPSPDTTPTGHTVDFRRTPVISGLQDIHKACNYVFYVADDKSLHSFALGGESSGVTLQSVSGGASNNILGQPRIEYTQEDGFSLYNYIHASGGNVNDHWTELNSSDWDEWSGVTGGNQTVSDDTTTKRVGAGSIKSHRTGSVYGVGVEIDFSGTKYDYSHLPFDELLGDIKFWARYADSHSITFNVTIQLRDTSNNKIAYQDTTSEDPDKWFVVSAPIGTKIYSTGNDRWRFATGSSFSWQVDKMEFFVFDWGVPPDDDPDDFWIDGLTLPVEAKSIETNAQSRFDYGRRDRFITRQDIRSQLSLDDLAADLLAKHKDPDIKTIGFQAVGNTSLHYPGQSVTLNIPSLAINSETWYIQSLHHVVAPYVDLGFGRDFLSRVSLAYQGSNAYDFDRVGLTLNPAAKIVHDINRSINALRQAYIYPR